MGRPPAAVLLSFLPADRSCCIAPAIRCQCKVTYDMEEERRLAYVALTRGRLRVTVSHCAFRRGFTKPSVFIEDLPAENVVHGWLHMPQGGEAAMGGAATGRRRQSRR